MFNNISSEHINYIIGFLQGDGANSVYKNKGRISIEISRRDIQILDDIEKILMKCVYIGRGERTRDTNFKLDYSSNSLHIYDSRARRWLTRHVPTGKKSSSITPPFFAKSSDLYHYIRGLTDSDGSLGITSLNRPFWSLCTGSEQIKHFIVKNIKDVLNKEKRLSRNKRDGVYNIVLYDEDAVMYTKLLYNNATLYLHRKYRKFTQLQDWKRSVLKRNGTVKKWVGYEDIVVLNNDLSLSDKCALLERSYSSIKTRLWRLKQK